MNAHVEPRRDDAEIVRNRGSAAHGQLSGYSLGQLDGVGDVGCMRIRIAARKNVSVMKHPAHASRHFFVRRVSSRFAARNPPDAHGHRPDAVDAREPRHATCSSRQHEPVLARRYVTSLKHFIRPARVAQPIATARSVWAPSSIFRASQYRRDGMAAAAPRVNHDQQPDRDAGTEPAFALQ
ncbi:hypothetical protein [Burkholderia sp. Bp9142]|uniref:hypothetical protein n=1 Tax=Burkholderia sp. Bp9142 TaxID=2184573 RepID=UPI000F5AA796|nr:hypothetical protein [Burkholderia sp. Bp9142]